VIGDDGAGPVAEGFPRKSDATFFILVRIQAGPPRRIAINSQPVTTASDLQSSRIPSIAVHAGNPTVSRSIRFAAEYGRTAPTGTMFH